MWITNAHIIARSCDLWYKQPNNNAQETSDLYDAIKQVAHETRVDHRFILAVVMEETRGCVRANGSIDDAAPSTGLLQGYKGTHTCNSNGKVTNPCPADNILGQIRDGGEFAKSRLFLASCAFADFLSCWICRGTWPSRRYQRAEQCCQQRNRLCLLPGLSTICLRRNRCV